MYVSSGNGKALKFSLKYAANTFGSSDLRSSDIESKLFLGTPIDRLIKSPVSGSMIPLNCGKHPGRSVMEVGDNASGR